MSVKQIFKKKMHDIRMILGDFCGIFNTRFWLIYCNPDPFHETNQNGSGSATLVLYHRYLVSFAV